MIYHITSRGAWEKAQAQGQYALLSLGDENGFRLPAELPSD